ncbi:MAG: Stp1/IreP family PP2C-type Ser/Thr phosphatase [Myxococcales bacterium]|nr:Stp1/IreP family PP2C-type Ser/Thr phosphatase [Myxococcales bacterium]
MKLRYAGSTHVGMRRSHNEDAFILVPKEKLYVVADGMGGHACGEVASRMTVETLEEFFRATSDDPETTWICKPDPQLSEQANRLRAAIMLANNKIYERAQRDPAHRGMGTTVVSAVFYDGNVSVAHVGDSRVYRWRGGELTQMTEDHSLLNDYKKIASLTAEEERNFQHKNIIVRALGMKADVVVDVLSETPQIGDIYLLCSDGLSGEVTDQEIASIISDSRGDLELACAQLIETACNNGGKDNVTAVIVMVTE